ncbi:MAG TPA: DUF3034 family protein, partial [Rhizobacter sp.]|nr:DUF3034 family protein [Rhizobacter sp.]
MPLKPRRLAVACATLPLALACATSLAQSSNHSGKLLLTGGVSSIDGAAGGGLTPWAVTGGYGTEGEIGGSAFVTRAKTRDYGLDVYGAALSYGDRVEFSFARQDFDTGPVGGALGLDGLRLKQDIFGAKLRLAGDAVLESDSWLPQIALGVEYKKADANRLESTLAAF